MIKLVNKTANLDNCMLCKSICIGVIIYRISSVLCECKGKKLKRIWLSLFQRSESEEKDESLTSFIQITKLAPPPPPLLFHTPPNAVHRLLPLPLAGFIQDTPLNARGHAPLFY